MAVPLLLSMSLIRRFRLEIVPRLFPRAPEGRRVILHGASIGEIKSLLPLARAMKNFGIPFLFTSATRNGVRLASSEGFEAYLFPLEFSLSHYLFFRRLSPSAIVVSERDYWMRFIYGVRKRGGKVMIVNFSCPEDTFLRRFFISLLKEAKPVFFARTDSDREFLLRAGFPSGNIKIVPSLKALSQEAPSDRPKGTLFLAVSMHRGECGFLKEAFVRIRRVKEIRLVLAPRYMKDVGVFVRAFSDFKTELFSATPQEFDVLVVDAYGVLPRFYREAGFAFVGGSIVKGGCHDLLEPASWKIPVFFGPHFWNQKEVAESLLRENGGRVVRTPEELFHGVLSLINEEEGAPSGERAFLVYRKIREKAREGLEEILEFLL